MLDRIEKIRKAVEHALKCPARHIESIAVVEGSRRHLVWQGIVEEFSLSGHPLADRAYAWQDGQVGQAKFFTVLKIRPINSASAAVLRAADANSYAQGWVISTESQSKNAASDSDRQPGNGTSAASR